MPDDDDIALSEKRVYGDRREGTNLYVASGTGIAHVAVSDDQIGRFGLDHQCAARDVAGRDGRLAVATDEDVLVGTDEGFAPTDFGPAVAVGFGDGILAADADGRVRRRVHSEWEPLGDVGAVRAIEGDLVAAADGVYHHDPDEGTLDHAGLDDVRDVAAAGPLAATGSGIYQREDGWNRAIEGDATVVASDGRRAHAVVDGTLYEREGGEWRDADAPLADLVDLTYGEATFGVTADGTVVLDPVDAKDGAPEWRSRSIGLRDVVGLAVA